MGNSNFLAFFMAGILITTAWGTSVLLQSFNDDYRGPQPDIEIRQAYRGQNNTLTLTMTNHGEPANFSKFKVQYRIDNQLYTRAQLQENYPERTMNTTCFTGDINWKTDVTYNCHTSIKYPSATNRVTAVISYDEGEMKWRKVCQPQTSSSVGC